MKLRKMINKIFFIYSTGVISLLLLTISCETTVGCEPFNNRFKAIGFETGLKKLVDFDSTSGHIELADFESDTLVFEELAIRMRTESESYQASAYKKFNFSIWTNAYACSPPPLTSDENVTDIQIFSDNKYSDQFDPNEDISELFDIIVFYHRAGYERYKLNDFTSSAPETPFEFYLIPNIAPSSTNSFEFTVKYFQDGLELDEFEFTTEPVILK